MRVMAVLMGVALIAGCATPYEPLEFVTRGDEIIVTGVIDRRALRTFEREADRNPQAKTLVLQLVDGSADDDANVVFSRVVRERGFDTVVPSDGLVASGGTDLFLAGNQRTLEPGACVGVHSWSSARLEGAELPRDDPEHDIYTAYFEAIGADPDFYWYTLEVASSDEMHWMSAAEVDRFDMTTGATPRLSDEATCFAR